MQHCYRYTKSIFCSSKWSMGGNTFNKNMEPNVNLQGMLKSIKQNERKLNSQPYTRDFGTYIGRFRPRSRGISGSVSKNKFERC